ncbi:Mitochondrial succinate-fumarate transporter [Maudiozyma exigua]|uniref:Mitochondrial succinate-fumarate transporter n=1 Tax=Maudiozyma exigua TaxID=34358 RepID=A0A9P7BBJ1_MAUEX|nr:Mitochondrial succinate-fumarate transporter [Kazachstania exigua]
MSQKKKASNPAINLIAGGTAGLFEALCCHPLDTIKVRMQIYKRAASGSIKPPGFIKTGKNIYSQEGFLALYKGLGAVVIGIIPKMAIRFSSYEFYRTLLADKNTGVVSTGNTFLAGVGAGITEAVIVVNPMEVVKIRLQAQHLAAKASVTAPISSSTAAAAAAPVLQTAAITPAMAAGTSAAATATATATATASPVKYRNAIHAGYTIIKEEGFGTLYRGVSLTAARQATNQGANFTVYSKLKEYLQKYHQTEVLPSWETSCIGLVSGAIGPFSNAPLDTIKTRLQKDKSHSADKTTSGWGKIMKVGTQLLKEEGFRALYKGITPRVMRVAPGQAVTFTVYEWVRGHLEQMGIFKQSNVPKPKALK